MLDSLGPPCLSTNVRGLWSMRIPVIKGAITSRLLVNFRVD